MITSKTDREQAGGGLQIERWHTFAQGTHDADSDEPRD